MNPAGIARQQIAAPAVDGAARGFHPVHQFGVALDASDFARQRAHHVDQRRGALGRVAQRVGLRIERRGARAQAAFEIGERGFQQAARDGQPGREREMRAAPRAPGRAHRRGPSMADAAWAGVLLPLAERAGERDEVRGEIARVDRRHVARFERPQIARVVPVVEVPAIACACAPSCRASPRCGRARRAGRTSRSRAPPPSTADRGRCWWVTCGAPPRRAGLPGNCRAAGDCLPPSRRSRRSARCAARSVAARAAGSAERSDFATAGGVRLMRQAISGAASPQQQEGKRDVRAAAADATASDQRRSGQRQHHAARHAAVEAAQVGARARQQVGRNPFEQVPVTHEHAPQRAADGVAHEPRLVGEHGDEQRRSARARQPKSRRSARRWLRSVTVERRGSTAANSRQQRRQRQRQQDECAPGQCDVRRQQSSRPAARRRWLGADSERRRLSSIFHSADERHAAVTAAVFLRRRHRAARRSTAAAASRRAPSDAGAARRRRNATEIPRPLRRPRPGRRARRCLRTGRGDSSVLSGTRPASAASKASTS